MKYAGLFIVGFILAFVSAFAQTAPGIRVIEEGAIPYTRFLSKSEFDQRYPGELLADPSALDSGWYVIYEHESLSYYFGPILLEATGQDYLAQLEATVGVAVERRPSIEGYRLELSYEPKVYTTSPPAVEPEPSEPPVDYGAPQPAPKPSIFQFLLRLFGFGR
jgi:hypothetical protein